jgi:hypothetical protein
MTPDHAITLGHLVVIVGVAIVFLAIPLGLLWWQDYEYRQRKRRYDAAKADDEARWQLYLGQQLAADRRRQAALEQQRQDHPAVTVPVTHCERRERRRILPLEGR